MSIEETTTWTVEQRWDLTYQHTADEVTATFLRRLRDEGTILGIRCPKCERVLTPPRGMCDRDFCHTEGWVELPLVGTLELFTIVYLPIQGLPDPPYVLAYVKPDGADTALPGFVDGVDLSSPEAAAAGLTIGSRMRIVPGDERTGRITDVRFRVDPTA